MAHSTQDVKNLLISTFDLELSADEIPDDYPIIGDGLGLDSVDILEIVSQIHKQYKIKIKNEDIKKDMFASIKNLTDFINNYKG